MQDCEQLGQESCEQDNCHRGQLETGEGSFSNPFITRDQDYSFSYGSPVTSESQQRQSLIFMSSFSSFQVDNNAPFSACEGFSFSNCGESGATDFSSPIPSMLSFTFFSPSSTVEKADVSNGFEATMSKADELHEGTCVTLIYLLFVKSYMLAVEIIHRMR